MLLASGPPRALGVEEGARLAFAEHKENPAAWAGRRLLVLDGKPAYELSFWCGTCQFMFERQDGATETLSHDALTDRLADGVDGLDEETIAAFGAVLPRGTYLPLLLRIAPRLVRPSGPGDYFSEEQVALWGLESFWSLPVYPRTPYFRTFETAVDAEAHLHEFVVPMVPPHWNDGTRVAFHRERLAASSRPTAVALSTLDVCGPATDRQTEDWHVHWGLTHFLLDGHHKLQAAAEIGAELQLLALVSVDGSLAEPAQVERLPELRARPRQARVPVA